VGVLARGRLIAEGTPSDLIDRTSGTVVSFVVPDSVAIADAASVFAPLFGAEVRLAGRHVEATLDQPTAAVHRLTGWAIEAGVELESLSVQRARLEDVYLALTTTNHETEEPA
jgi:ABC-2 type transport system ATP-binding protein